ncbi:Nicotianamine synthase [Lasiosphaeria hispida]|uniref:Nicotianamine synthase n=1 Tax=Lasiosphaeria hispida TaxID=260671 RepID=A0AAJ0HPJ6_9PEZI|nr:Nicotianamine synthase [Lasiosphaeria hispida]
MSFFLSWLGLRPKAQITQPPAYLCTQSQESITIIEKEDVTAWQKMDAQKEAAIGIANTVVATHTELCKLTSYAPGETINRLLGNLVSVCSQIHETDVVQEVLDNADLQAMLPSLRIICALAESELESHWNAQILAGSNEPEHVFSRLKSFPYYENYEDLTRMELFAILSATKTAPQKFAFLGSGPLPLTSLCLLDLLNSSSRDSVKYMANMPENAKPTVLNIDIDASALDSSRNLSAALGPRGEGMEFKCVAAGSEDQSLVEYDVVYVAALVGQSQEQKEEILLKVASRMRKGALVVIRSAWGLRTCLYAQVDITTERILGVLEPCVVMDPYTGVVNSVIVAKVRA